MAGQAAIRQTSGKMVLDKPVKITRGITASTYECDRFHFGENFAEIDFGGVWLNKALWPQGQEPAVVRQARVAIEERYAEVVAAEQAAELAIVEPEIVEPEIVEPEIVEKI